MHGNKKDFNFIENSSGRGSTNNQKTRHCNREYLKLRVKTSIILEQNFCIRKSGGCQKEKFSRRWFNWEKNCTPIFFIINSNWLTDWKMICGYQNLYIWLIFFRNLMKYGSLYKRRKQTSSELKIICHLFHVNCSIGAHRYIIIILII